MSLAPAFNRECASIICLTGFSRKVLVSHADRQAVDPCQEHYQVTRLIEIRLKHKRSQNIQQEEQYLSMMAYTSFS